MIVTVQREKPSALSTIGSLSIGGLFFCYSLEPATPIPAGSYKGSIVISPEWTAKRGYPFKLVLLQDVPGHTGIEIHIGNFPRDTKDCTLVGMGRLPDELVNSETAFFKLFHRLAGETDLEFQYLDAQ